MITYRYTIDGDARQDQTWSVSGDITIDREGDFTRAVLQAQEAAFLQLTHGQAVYGRPQQTCQGPYRIRRLIVERE